MEYEIFAKRIKRKRVILLIVSILAAVALLAFSGEYNKWVNGALVEHRDGPIPDSTAILGLIILIVVNFFIFALDEGKITEIHNKKCRPEVYLSVKVALTSKRKQEKEPMRYAKMVVADALGDYASSENYANTLRNAKNAMMRLGVLTCMTSAAFARHSLAECEEVMRALDAMFVQTTKNGMRKRVERARQVATLAALLLRGDYEEAAKVADAIDVPEETVSEVGVAYYQGLAYMSAPGREADALYAFMLIQKKGGSTRYVQQSRPLIEEIKTRLAKNTISE